MTEATAGDEAYFQQFLQDVYFAPTLPGPPTPLTTRPITLPTTRPSIARRSSAPPAFNSPPTTPPSTAAPSTPTSSAPASSSTSPSTASSTTPPPVPVTLLEALQHALEHGIPDPPPGVRLPLTKHLSLIRINEYITRGINIPIKPRTRTRPRLKMANRLPVLSTANLPTETKEEQAATASPARGTAMLNSIFKSVRVPEFRHKWMFWAEKGQQTTPKDKSAQSEEYASRPKALGEQIVSIKDFYQHFNNIPVDNLKLRDSIHLFHFGVKPVWEDPRNSRGGAWYFKIPKDIAAQFWHEICLLAVGDVLQGAVETKRPSFNDDICGLSYSVRWNAVQIAVWNRDAANEAGKEKLLATILEKLSEELRPKKEDSYWYKAHKEHKGFIEQ